MDENFFSLRIFRGKDEDDLEFEEQKAKRIRMLNKAVEIFKDPKLNILITSHLNDINDLKNCFLLSKEIRTSLLESPKIMLRLTFIFEPLTSSLNYVKVRLMAKQLGIYIRNLKVQLAKTPSNYINELSKFLSQVPNLDSLAFETVDSHFRNKISVLQSVPIYSSSYIPQQETEEDLTIAKTDSIYKFDLSNLNSLDIRFQDLKIIMPNINSFHNLQKLSLTLHEFYNDGYLIDFFIFIYNLKDLSITECKDDLDFKGYHETRNMKNIFETLSFKLKRFNLNARSCNDKFVTKFIETQVDNLEELELTFELDERIFGRIWSKFKMLKKLKLSCAVNCITFIEHFHDVQIDTVTSFESIKFSNLNQNVKKFPNLEIFKGMELMAMNAEFTKITTLDIEVLNLSLVRNVKFPNLKNFKVRNCIKPCKNQVWISFCENISSIENVKLKCIDGSICDCCVLDCLSIFKNLKSFEYEHKLNVPSDLKLNTDYNFNEYYKVIISTSQKSIKVCNFIVENDMNIFLKLFTNFDGFEFTENYFEDDKKKSIVFDPADALLNRTRPIRTNFLQKVYDETFTVCQDCYSNEEAEVDTHEINSFFHQFVQ